MIHSKPKNNRLAALLAACSLTFAAASSHALQVLDAPNGATLYAKISKTEQTRISLDQGRLGALRAREGTLNIDPDQDTGQFFVTVPHDVTKPISAFLTTETGLTYTLVLEIVDGPSDSIIIKQPRIATKTAPVLTGPKAGPFSAEMKRMLLAIVNGVAPDGVEATHHKQPVALWRETDFVLETRFTSSDLIAERFALTNISSAPLTMDEREFFKKGVYLVALDQHTLKPNAQTWVYILRERSAND